MWEWLREILSESLGYLKFWVMVNQFEEGVLLSWGKFKRILKPGTHLKWPIMDYCYSTIVKYDTISIDEVNITTSDGLTITIGCIIEYDVEDVRKFLIETNDAKSNMKDVCRGVLSNVLEDCTWDEITKKTTMNKVKRMLESKYNDMGVRMKDVMFTDKCKTKALKLFTTRPNQDISVTHL